MPASLYGTRFVGMRTPGWHELGTVLQDQVSAEEAVKVGKIDYSYVSAPIGYSLPDGTFVQDDDRIAVLREPSDDDPIWRRMGIVGKGYRYIQNIDLAKGLDAICKKTGWAFETAGALNEGGTVFLTLDAGTRSVVGDEYRTYFIVADGKAVGRMLQISIAKTRVVCMNTLMAAESSASMTVKIAHDVEVADEYAFWTDLVAGLEKSRDLEYQQLEKMTTVRITPEEAGDVIAAAFPMPKKNRRARMAEMILLDPTIDDDTRSTAIAQLQGGIDTYEYYVQYVQKRRDTAKELYEKFSAGEEQGGSMPNAVLARVAETPYAALQAVTELLDWGGSGSAKASAESAIFGSGSRAKARAWSTALALSAGDIITVQTILAASQRDAERVSA